MARTHGRTQTAIWKDKDFIALDERPQRIYLFLTSQDDLSHAGLIPLRITKWASKAPSLDEQGLLEALDVLERERFVVVDHGTEELLIRTFVRNDGVYKQPKVMIRMRQDAGQIESQKLRAAFLIELDRLPLDELSDKPGGPNGDLPSTRAAVAAVVDTLRADFADAVGYPIGGVSDTHGEGYGIPPAYARAPSPFPQPPSPSPLPPSPVQPSAAELALRDEPAALTPHAETLGQHGNRLAKAYTDRVKLSNFPAIAGIARKAIQAGKTDAEITDAFIRLAEEGRPVTADTLRIEIEGLRVRGTAANAQAETEAMFDRAAQRAASREVAQEIA